MPTTGHAARFFLPAAANDLRKILRAHHLPTRFCNACAVHIPCKSFAYTAYFRRNHAPNPGILQRNDFQRFNFLPRRREKRKAFVFEKEDLRFRKRCPSFCKTNAFFFHSVLGALHIYAVSGEGIFVAKGWGNGGGKFPLPKKNFAGAEGKICRCQRKRLPLSKKKLSAAKGEKFVVGRKRKRPRRSVPRGRLVMVAVNGSGGYFTSTFLPFTM